MDQFHQDEIDVILSYLEASEGDILKTSKATGISPRKLKELVAAWEQKAKDENEASDVEEAEDDPDEADGAALSYKQQQFVNAYLGAANGNATEAARLAGYKGSDNVLGVTGHENLRKPKIRAAIDARMDAMAMSANEVLFRVSEQARADIADFGQGIGDRFLLDLGKAQRRGKTRLVKKLGYNPNGDPTLELYSSQAALKILAQYHGLLSNSRDDELDALLERLVAAAAEKRQAATEGPPPGESSAGGE
jgi:hypothetical protein